MDGCLDFQAVSAFADPDYAVAGFFSVVENSDDVAGAEIGMQSREQRATQADIAGMGGLQETVPTGVNAPDAEDEVGIAARLAAAVVLWLLRLIVSSISWFWIQAIVWFDR